jgi:hypothetical protein
MINIEVLLWVLSVKNCHEMKSSGASLECMKKQLTPSTSVFCFQLCDLSQSGSDPQKWLNP